MTRDQQQRKLLSFFAPQLPALSTANFHLIIQPWGQHRDQGAGGVWEPPPQPQKLGCDEVICGEEGAPFVLPSVPGELACIRSWLLQDVWLGIQTSLFYLAALG